MGKVLKRYCSMLIPSESDRHANKLDIYSVGSGRNIHLNFRNLQIRLSKLEFQEWKLAFRKAKIKLGNRMDQDGLEPVVNTRSPEGR